MPFQPAPGVIGVVIEYDLNNQLAENTLYFFQNAADPTVSDCITIATLVRDWIEGAVFPQLSNQILVRKVVAKNLAVNEGARGVVIGTGANGGITTEMSPNLVAATITFDTGFGGKSSHGRNYIPAIPNVSININFLDPAFMTFMVAAYEELKPGGAHDPTPYSWSVLSRVHAGVVMANAIAVPVANVYFTDNVVDSQRRRGPGRGK
jgi:hypothetical protein